MDGYLDESQIDIAIGDLGNLPAPSELQRMMGEAEKLMFMRQSRIPDILIETAWVLHSVGSSRLSLELYEPERVRRSAQISAHVFDLVVEQGIEDEESKLIYTIASQVGYLRGELTPNVMALYRNLQIDFEQLEPESHTINLLKVSTAFIALDKKTIFEVVPELQKSLGDIDLLTKHDSKYFLITILDCIWHTMLYLTDGDDDNLSYAKNHMKELTSNPDSVADLNCRWAAALLEDVIDTFGQTSLWKVVPPDLPRSSVKALSLGSPPILTLWPPQIKLLTQSDVNPLTLSMKRIIISVPTSAGKTLISQLFISSHLAQNGGGVCVITPSHSLAREVKKSLHERLRFMDFNVEYGLPDDYIDEDMPTTDVEVMTPERLSFLLKADSAALLARFKLFVVDEAHIINDVTRGWVIESALSLINMMTTSTEHRIIMMSSAIGENGHIHTWLDTQADSMSFHSKWRGPRRLYAMYSPEKDLSIPADIIPAKRKNSKTLKHFKMKGVIRLRIADTDATHEVRLTESVGDLYHDSNRPYKRHDSSTSLYKMLVPLIISVAETGPVLIITPDKKTALSVAKEIAESTEEDYSSSVNVAKFAELRLGAEHPLPKVLKKGVAYHHAALPKDVQESIESAVKKVELRYIVATTTLAEGVNLPVRTVIISNTGGFRRDGEYEEFITGSTLINAIGRAGRAGKESEGWIILAGKYDAERLNQLININADDVEIKSNLISGEFIKSLEQYEQLIRSNEDAAMSLPFGPFSNYISQIWSISNSIENAEGTVDNDAVQLFLTSTLAWSQMDSELQQRWATANSHILSGYLATDVHKRRRWSKSGASIPSTNTIDSISHDIFNKELMRFADQDTYLQLDDLIETFFADGVLERLLSLPESRRVRFKSSRGARNTEWLNVDEIALMRDWIRGLELEELIDKYLLEISDREFAYESLGAYLTATYEQYLPWVTGLMTQWINGYDQEFTEGRPLINPFMPQFIRYGINSNIALRMMMGGIRSRRFARVLADGYAEASELGFELQSWLLSLSLDDLTSKYDANIIEIDDFKSYISSDRSSFLSELISQRHAEIEFFVTTDLEVGPVNIIKSITSLDNDTYYINQESEMLEIPICFHQELELFLETGLKFEVSVVDVSEYSITLSLDLVDY